jgi:hypothetical protein
MAEQNVAIQPRLNIPYQSDMLGDGVHIAPRALHRVGRFKTSAAGQRQ